jgi:hypothetical protein
MTTQKVQGTGFRHAQILALGSNLLPLVASAGATAYEGVTVDGVRALTLNTPEPQIVHHAGEDRVMQVDFLPPTEAATGELTTGMMNLTLDALLSNVNVVDIGDMKVEWEGTDQQGNEIQACIVAYRQALVADNSLADFGARRWEFVLIPVAKVYPRKGPWEQGGDDENTYTVQPQIASAYPWGIALAEDTEGHTQGQIARGISVGRPKLVAWMGDGSVTTFNLPATAKLDSSDTPKIQLYHWVASTETASDVTSSETLAADSVTFTSAPAEDDIVVALYELAD